MLNPGKLAIAPSGYAGFTLMQGAPHGQIDGTLTQASLCGGSTDVSANPYDSGFKLMPDLSGPDPSNQGDYTTIFIATPAGQMDFTGTRTDDTPTGPGDTEHDVFTYSLHKTCSEGGTDC